jgi:hypothetical protein
MRITLSAHQRCIDEAGSTRTRMACLSTCASMLSIVRSYTDAARCNRATRGGKSSIWNERPGADSTCSRGAVYGAAAFQRAHLRWLGTVLIWLAQNIPMDRRSAVAGSSGAARPRPGCGAGIVFPIPRLCSTILSQIPKLGASRVFKAGWQLKHSPAACGASGTERACTKPRQWRRSTSGCFSEVRPSVRSLSVPVRSMHAPPECS